MLYIYIHNVQISFDNIVIIQMNTSEKHHSDHEMEVEINSVIQVSIVFYVFVNFLLTRY